jgi:hypothetical protein
LDNLEARSLSNTEGAERLNAKKRLSNEAILVHTAAHFAQKLDRLFDPNNSNNSILFQQYENCTALSFERIKLFQSPIALLAEKSTAS